MKILAFPSSSLAELSLHCDNLGARTEIATKVSHMQSATQVRVCVKQFALVHSQSVRQQRTAKKRTTPWFWRQNPCGVLAERTAAVQLEGTPERRFRGCCGPPHGRGVMGEGQTSTTSEPMQHAWVNEHMPMQLPRAN
jgi:hypothetical protein